MGTTLRHRLSRAATVGLAAAAIAVAAQYFIALPVGDQPAWLALAVMVLLAPSAYVILPLRDPIEYRLQLELGSGPLTEAATPFGPALRAGSEDILLAALGTIIMVGIIAYLAGGVQEMLGEKRSAGAVGPR